MFLVKRWGGVQPGAHPSLPPRQCGQHWSQLSTCSWWLVKQANEPIRIQLSIMMPLQIWILIPPLVYTLENLKILDFLHSNACVPRVTGTFLNSVIGVILSTFWTAYWNFLEKKYGLSFAWNWYRSWFILSNVRIGNSECGSGLESSYLNWLQIRILLIATEDSRYLS